MKNWNGILKMTAAALALCACLAAFAQDERYSLVPEGAALVMNLNLGKLYSTPTFKAVADSGDVEAIRKDLDTRFAGVPMILRTAYTGDAAIGKAWNAQVQEQFPEYQVTGDPLPISIACHVGPGVIALGLIKKII